jgi:anti-anti-sigma regulatory factor
MLTIQQTTSGGVVCRPVGELDAYSVSQFRLALAETTPSPNLVIAPGAGHAPPSRSAPAVQVG